MKDDFEINIMLAKTELRQARLRLQSEIAEYPTPISGCDAQFNHLIAERQKVLDALGSLETIVFVPTPRSPHPTAGIESR